MNLQLKFPADTGELARMRHAARDFLLAADVPEMEAELMVLALDEACTNIIRHAYGGCTERAIRISLESTRSGIRCTLRDYGKSCDPSKIRSRDLTDFRPGGLGVRILHSAFDSVVFEPQPRGTRLTLVKSRKSTPRAASAVRP
jgi:anti-sigma regulatory factor (Ser/Thr protein kinase)